MLTGIDLLNTSNNQEQGLGAVVEDNTGVMGERSVACVTDASVPVGEGEALEQCKRDLEARLSRHIRKGATYERRLTSSEEEKNAIVEDFARRLLRSSGNLRKVFKAIEWAYFRDGGGIPQKLLADLLNADFVMKADQLDSVEDIYQLYKEALGLAIGIDLDPKVYLEGLTCSYTRLALSKAGDSQSMRVIWGRLMEVFAGQDWSPEFVTWYLLRCYIEKGCLLAENLAALCELFQRVEPYLREKYVGNQDKDLARRLSDHFFERVQSFARSDQECRELLVRLVIFFTKEKEGFFHGGARDLFEYVVRFMAGASGGSGRERSGAHLCCMAFELEAKKCKTLKELQNLYIRFKSRIKGFVVSHWLASRYAEKALDRCTTLEELDAAMAFISEIKTLRMSFEGSYLIKRYMRNAVIKKKPEVSLETILERTCKYAQKIAFNKEDFYTPLVEINFEERVQKVTTREALDSILDENIALLERGYSSGRIYRISSGKVYRILALNYFKRANELIKNKEDLESVTGRAMVMAEKSDLEVDTKKKVIRAYFRKACEFVREGGMAMDAALEKALEMAGQTRYEEAKLLVFLAKEYFKSQAQLVKDVDGLNEALRKAKELSDKALSEGLSRGNVLIEWAHKRMVSEVARCYNARLLEIEESS